MKRTSTLKALIASALCALITGCSSAPTEEQMGRESAALDVDSNQHVFNARGSPRSSAGPLVDHSGRVLPASNAYAIWWGDPAAFPSDAQTGITSLFQGLAGTTFLNIDAQYMRGASTTVSFSGNLTDASTPPARGPSTSAIAAEACQAINANGLVADPTAIYFIFTSNFPSGHVNYCAWHSYGTCNGVTIQVAYMPNVAGVAGCNPLQVANFSCNSYSEGTVALANVTSHEFMEAVTDADISAWYDSSGAEIGDKCSWQFSSCVNLTTGPWQLQKEWSNATGGCVQQ